MAIVLRILMASALMVGLLSVGGCKQQQQMQQQIEALDGKAADVQKRMTSLENELKKNSFEITQLKALVTKLGNVVVDLQKAEEERQKAAEAARAAAASKMVKKKGPVKPAPHKHH